MIIMFRERWLIWIPIEILIKIWISVLDLTKQMLVYYTILILLQVSLIFFFGPGFSICKFVLGSKTQTHTKLTYTNLLPRQSLGSKTQTHTKKISSSHFSSFSRRNLYRIKKLNRYIIQLFFKNFMICKVSLPL